MISCEDLPKLPMCFNLFLLFGLVSLLFLSPFSAVL